MPPPCKRRSRAPSQSTSHCSASLLCHTPVREDEGQRKVGKNKTRTSKSSTRNSEAENIKLIVPARNSQLHSWSDASVGGKDLQAREERSQREKEAEDRDKPIVRGHTTRRANTRRDPDPVYPTDAHVTHTCAATEVTVPACASVPPLFDVALTHTHPHIEVRACLTECFE